MRVVRYLAFMAAATLVLSLGAFARDFHSGKFDLTQPARIGSTMLPAGHYTAEWSGANDAVNVTILSHGKTVATAQGQIKEMPSKSPYGAVSTRTLSDQSQQVDEIDFDNRTEALILQGA